LQQAPCTFLVHVIALHRTALSSFVSSPVAFILYPLCRLIFCAG
jgi:hypothetical protein